MHAMIKVILQPMSFQLLLLLILWKQRNKVSFFRNLNLILQDNYPCFPNCNINGVCEDRWEACVCNEGWFYADCSVQATKVTLDKAVQQSVPTKSWRYFYYKVAGNNILTKLLKLIF